MAQPSGNYSPNQQRGNKRPFSNAEGGPRNDHGGKFQRKSFDNRPFHKGGNRSFDRGRGGNRSFNNGNRFNKDDNFNRGRNNQNFGRGRGNQNFNRGNFQGRNNQNFRKGGFQNNKFNKSWEGNRSAPDFEQNPNANKHKKFDEGTEEAAVDRVDNQPKDKKLKNPVQTVELIDDDETSSSESEEEIETNLQKNQNAEVEESSSESEEETSSESEEEIETSLNDLQKKQIVNENKHDEEEETSSESEEEIEVISKTIQNKNKEDEEETSSESEDEIGIIKESEEQKEIATSSKNKNQASSSTVILNDDVNSGETKGEDQCKIYVHGLPHYTINKEQIGKFFERYGKIKRVLIIKENFMYAVITFKKAEDVKKALEVNGMIYKDHRISVRRHRNFDNKDDSKTIKARKIPFDIRYEDLWNALELTCGPIRTLALPLKHSKVMINKGFAFIEFEHLDSKELALAMKQITIKDKVIELAQYVKQERISKTSTNFLRKAPFNKPGPRRFSAGPSNVRVQQNQHNKSFTITFGDNSYQGPPKFNARKPYMKSRRPYN